MKLPPPPSSARLWEHHRAQCIQRAALRILCDHHGQITQPPCAHRTRWVNEPLRSEPKTQEARECINRSLNVTISVSYARGRKGPLTCRSPVSSTGPRCGCWGVRQWLDSSSPSVPGYWDSPALHIAKGHTGVNVQKRPKAHHTTNELTLCLDARDVSNWKSTLPKNPSPLRVAADDLDSMPDRPRPAGGCWQ